MTLDLDPLVEALLRLGDPGTHPAGAVVGVLAGAEVSVAAGGYAVMAGPGEAARPMTADTRLDLASVTKVASTTALAMRLVADGTLDLEASVTAYLPEVGGDHAQVRVRHLLEHTSGLPAWLPLYCRTTVRDEALALAAATSLLCEPGTHWAYSDLGMITLGAVIEGVTGRRQDEAFDELVARPLGLRRTGYGPVPAEEAAASGDSDVVEHHMVAQGDPYPVEARVGDFDGWRTRRPVGEVNDGNAAHALDGVAGHAGLFATVPELLRLGRSLADPAVVPPEVVAAFTRPLAIAPDRALGFRLASVAVAGEAVPLAVHGGFTGTFLAVALDRELAVAVAATRLHGTTGTPERPLTPLASLVSTDEIAATALAGVASAFEAGGRALPARTTDRPRLETGAP
ncbi:serine hydrolase [Knoellia sp. p5-6-4]|uniref:serine hydrolase domain-containing protein n=1 Tax=unclassified Knoellia TaxID=2618719 RepID=UPI0023DADE56|nr:serine hydrolase domain-containing protein [Knoellia sp. p5-6-4]MDF2144903.1 serine hydrolase [Knoellia sp. p5-6-4]